MSGDAQEKTALRVYAGSLHEVCDPTSLAWTCCICHVDVQVFGEFLALDMPPVWSCFEYMSACWGNWAGQNQGCPLGVASWICELPVRSEAIDH